MAQYESNNAYLEIDGTDVSGYWTGTADAEQSADIKEGNYGAGQEYVRRVGGLIDTTISFSIIYDTETTAKAESFNLFRTGQIVDIVYGPEGQIAGKPRHAGKFYIDSLTGPSVDQEKAPVMVEISLSQQDEPTDDMYNGGVFV